MINERRRDSYRLIVMMDATDNYLEKKSEPKPSTFAR